MSALVDKRPNRVIIHGGCNSITHADQNRGKYCKRDIRNGKYLIGVTA